jgi:hypothetical protein
LGKVDVDLDVLIYEFPTAYLAFVKYYKKYEYNGAVQCRYRWRAEKGTGEKGEILSNINAKFGVALHPLNKNEWHQEANLQKITCA